MGKTRSLVTAAFLAAVLVASKFALDGLPNIELVSLLVILYTLEYPWLAVPAVYTYGISDLIRATAHAREMVK